MAKIQFKKPSLDHSRSTPQSSNSIVTSSSPSASQATVAETLTTATLAINRTSATSVGSVEQTNQDGCNNYVVQSIKNKQNNKSNKVNSDSSSAKSKSSGGLKFFSAFHTSSSSAPSRSAGISIISSATQSPSSSVNKQQLQCDANKNSTAKPARSKSKRFSLRISSKSAVTKQATQSGASSAAKANIGSQSSNKAVISNAMPPYELEVTDVDGVPYIECPLCVLLVSYDTTPDLKACGHRTCLECMQRYLKTEINHSRLNITCPICSEPLFQNVIREILGDDKFYFKYESFMLRTVLAAEPDARWCPAPDCGYAVLANGCASCPRLICEKDGCNTEFCYHCKQEWHPNQTCSAASVQRNKRAGFLLNALNISDLIEESNNGGGPEAQGNRKSSKTSQQNATLRPEDIKECPVCSSRIIKMNDGSCNHMTCSICKTEFCWLCMKEISDFHYFSPSGCTFWGKKPWSRKKKFLWRLGMLIGAPICIVFIAGITVPIIVFGIPFWAARKLHARLEKKQFSRYRKNAILTGGVLLSFLVSPFITAMALAVGIPCLLGYVYGVVPLSLCRSSGGCLSASPSVEDLQEQFTQAAAAARRLNAQATDVVSIDTAASHKIGNPSIGETSMYMSNISLETNSIGHVTNVERDDRESASNAALAGSIFSQNADDGNSTRALAGSIMSKDSGGYTLIPVEIHSHNNGSTNNQAAAIVSLASSGSDRTSSQPRQSLSDINVSEQAEATAS